jgi:hypothetical protein
MKKLTTFLSFVILFSFFSSRTINAEELGTNIFVFEPSTPPIAERKKMKIWPCNGNIAEEYIKQFTSAITFIAKDLVKIGTPVTCTYQIGTNSFTDVPIYLVQFYSANQSLSKCIEDIESCNESMVVRFHPFKQNLFFSYMVSDFSPQGQRDNRSHSSCLDSTLKVLTIKESCFEYLRKL